jgi:hypothetical protein
MQFLKKWFGESSGADDAVEHEETERFSTRAEALRKIRAADEYHDDTSFSWSATESVSSSVFDTPRKPTIAPREESVAEDTGYDPYDTGRFV